MLRLHVFIGFLILLALTASLAFGQEKPARECSPSYIAEIEDDLQANKDMRRWTTDYLRPACRGIQRTEELAGKYIAPYGGKWLWDKTLGDYLDPTLTSQTCRYFRKLGEQILTPEQDEKRLQSELKRCTDELKK